MGKRSDAKTKPEKGSIEIVFDGSSVTATTSKTSAILRITGYSVSPTDVGRVLVIRGGTNFMIGAYVINAMALPSNTWTLDRHCSISAGACLRGELVSQEGRCHNPVPEYFDAELPNNPAKGEARQRVLEALNLVEPGILESLAETCFTRALLDPEVVDDHDWCGPCFYLLWGHVKDAGNIVPSMGVVSGNLSPLKAAVVRWARDEPQHRWNLCCHAGEPIEWIADAAVQTLAFWLQRGRLPKNLRWENLDFHCYRSLDSEDAFTMFDMERHFDAGAGFLRIVPESGIETTRLSDRAQRKTMKEYKSLGEGLRLKRMQRLSGRYFEWYALRTFLGIKLREIREREFGTKRKAGIGSGVGDPQDPEDLSAISHGITKVAELVEIGR